jgi:hypothetical protein
MGRVKEIVVKVLPATIANDFVKKHHYSGKVVPNSQLHFGAFLDNQLMGVLSYGPSINKKGTINLVKDTGWNEFIELNRMAFADALPKNSESRVIAITLRLIKKQAPHIKWVISFADGTQCGDGTIYRASGFKLVEIRENNAIRVDPTTGKSMHTIQAYHLKKTKEFKKWQPIVGYQLKYIYLLDKNAILNTKILPFSAIDDFGAGMYKGSKVTLKERQATD